MKNPAKLVDRLIIFVIALWLCGDIPGHAQVYNPNMAPSAWSNVVDFAVLDLEQQNKDAKHAEEQKRQRKELVDGGIVSALDLVAPKQAIEELNHGVALLKEQKSNEAIKHLQKAIATYPKFVSAHLSLGAAYLDQNDTEHAQSEFETAAKLDDKFPRPFMRLGVLAMSQKDFATANLQLEKAASLSPRDARVLSALVYAQEGNHQYRQALETAQRVHALEHKELADMHFVAAIAARALNDFDTMERELSLFVSEDPAAAFAPIARHNLEVLAHNKNLAKQVAGGPVSPELTMSAGASQPVQTFPDTERLKAELSALGGESEGESDTSGEADAAAGDSNNGMASGTSSAVSSHTDGWTIRKVVDEVAYFFAVSSHGRMVSDLEQSNIQIRDDGKPPERVLQFVPQSKLPLRLALLVDTSGSVEGRFSFEKRAARKFIDRVLSNPSDLAFVAGFASDITVTQDFTAQKDELGNGIEKLTNKGGTRLFDAVSFACWKLAAYPEHERVAKVLVILSDGEDNSSRRSLKQSIQDAETMGVTIYTVSTSEVDRGKTAADKVLQVLAERSGGEAMFPGDIMSLGKSLDELGDLIRSRYLIAYKPADFTPNGKYRAIQITAERDGKHLQVHARKGYYARLEATQK